MEPNPPSPAATPPPPSAPDPPRRRGGKRKAAAAGSPVSSPAPAPKRLMKERNALQILSASAALHHGPVTRAARLTPATPPPPPPPAPDPVMSVVDDNPAPLQQPLVDLDYETIRSRDRNVHAVPTPAGWFSWEKVHAIEKHTMRSFFNGKSESRTPEVYMDIRNAIMKKFRSDLETLVEVKDLEELTVGDMDARQEVMEFLDHWGLINFHPFPPAEPEDAAVRNLDSDLVLRASSLIEKLYRFEKVEETNCVVPKKVEVQAPTMHTPDLSLALVGDLAVPVEPSVEYHCNSCSADCSRTRYHCQKQADFDLCTECYNAGEFGSGMAAADFILMEPADVPGVSCGSWTDQETLLLLEALELFGGNWSEIAEHVATKTKDQCMLHFMQMPIEYPFLDVKDEDMITAQEGNVLTLTYKESESSNAPETKETKSAADMGEHISSTKDDSNIGLSTEIDDSSKTSASIVLDILNAAFEAVGYLPERGGIQSFSEAGNPVMALAAFLTGLVEPDVATISIRSSLKAMLEDSPGIQLATRHCYLLEDPPNDVAAESMDIGQPHKEEEHMPISNGTDESKFHVDKNENNDVQEEMETEPSNTSQKLPAEDKLAESVSVLEATPLSTKDSGDQSLEKEQIMATVKDVSVSVLPVVLPSSNTKELADLALQGENMESTAMETNNLDISMQEIPDSSKESVENSNAAGVMITSAPAEGQEELKATSDSPAKSTEKTGDDDKVSPLKDDDKKALLNVVDENQFNSVVANVFNNAPLNDTVEKICSSVEAHGDKEAPLNDIDDNNLNSVQANVDRKAPITDLGEKSCDAVKVNDDKAFGNGVGESCNPVEVIGERTEPPSEVDEKGNPIEVSDERKEPSSEVDEKGNPIEVSDERKEPPSEVDEKGNPIEASDERKEPPSEVDEKVNPIEASDERKEPPSEVDDKCNLIESKDDKKAPPNDVAEKKCAPIEGNGDRETPLDDVDVKNCNPVKANADDDTSKIRRAAVTALSAAAVKAKLLANQEEEQIMQLVSVVIEKQLYKLETKLSHFSEIESVITRVREQIDRARQKLLQERQQIVAARLGMPATPVPASKPPLGYGPELLRPPSMASLKPPPPMRRP